MDQRRGTKSPWLAISATVGLACLQLVAGACPPCDIVDSLLKPCNSSLKILTWPGTFVYQPLEEQAMCACNENYHQQIEFCLTCESSSSAKYSVKELSGYKLVCTSFGQTWKDIHIPGQTTTPAPTTPPPSTSAPGTTSSGASTSTSPGPNSGAHLSSGAIAGIVVSAIALVVALSVAAYVYGRRRKERAKEFEEGRQYKFNDSQRDSYMEVALPQYTGMIQPTLPPISKVSNLRVMNPDSDDEETPNRMNPQGSFEVNRTSSPGWRRGSFDDD